MMDTKSTTILALRRNGQLVIGGDGQMTLGDSVLKNSTYKLRKLHHDQVLAGFAGSTADAISLYELFATELGKHSGHLKKAAVEVAKKWRGDRMMRNLEAHMIVGDQDDLFLIGGNGDVISPDEAVIAIGSGSLYALSAARALLKHTQMSAHEIVEAGLTIAADTCIYTNHQFSFLSLSAEGEHE